MFKLLAGRLDADGAMSEIDRAERWAAATGNPVARGQEERLRVDLERATYWQGQGAQVSDRVSALLKEAAKQAA